MSEENEFYKENSATTEADLKCKNCGNPLKFEAGKEALVCQSCNTENIVSSENEVVSENDYLSIINALETESTNKAEVHTVHCDGCGANTTLKDNESSAECPYCGGSLIVSQQETHNALKPEYVLPFKVDGNKAQGLFKSWINGLWWAPNKLKKLAKQVEKLVGVYYPYWTYDSNTVSQYTGQRGIDYTETETYEDSDGNTQTRTVTKTNWYFASGTVSNMFDDVLVVASESLPKKYVRKLEPWDLENLKEFKDEYLSGFRTETYFIDLQNGFEIAKGHMQDPIRSSVNRDIGGDRQRIFSLSTDYNDIKFKHILLPIWISAYKYNDKIYRFVVNGRTGEVQGERPYSWIKITLAILAGLAAGGAIWYFTQQ